MTYVLAKPGQFCRTTDGLSDFEEDGRVFLLYAGAGESGIAIAEVFID